RESVLYDLLDYLEDEPAARRLPLQRFVKYLPVLVRYAEPREDHSRLPYLVGALAVLLRLVPENAETLFDFVVGRLVELEEKDPDGDWDWLIPPAATLSALLWGGDASRFEAAFRT